MSALTPRIDTVEANTPAGVMYDYAGTAAPSGFMMCDGAAISRVTYAGLFAALGTSYGVGDGSTTFNIPDFRGRFARYNDNMGTGAASRDTGRVHGSTQTQTTAKNGLSNAANSTGGGTTGGGTTGAMNVGVAYGINNGGPVQSGVAGPGQIGGSDNTMRATSVPGLSVPSLTVAAQVISGDAETRPINLSCNKIIKV